MTPYQLKLPESKLQALRNLSEITGLPVSHHIRVGIDMVLHDIMPCGMNMSGQLVSGYMHVMTRER